MNLIWNKNIELFEKRFPQLINAAEKKCSSEIVIETAKDNSPTAKWKNLYLHSKYNPLREAQNLISSYNENENKAFVFIGMGLGYAPLEACKYKDSTIIIIEKSFEHFYTALNTLDFTKLFEHGRLVIFLDAGIEEITLILSRFKENELFTVKTKAQTEYASEYFERVSIAIEQLKNKDEINEKTLEKFSKLWTRNSCKNLKWLSKTDGVKKYVLQGRKLSFIIIAAGPSLQKVLPCLKELKKRAVLVCVNTALHALLKAGVEPDFIVIVDPQYYCYLHIKALSSPSSTMILESAVYPSIFRFKCKEKVMCSSMFPIGQYFEKQLGEKGALGAGGSVTTTAWDFARICGAKEIFLCGMDLGFPNKMTHIKGSYFEQNAHTQSNKFNTAENFNVASLIGSAPEWKKDYNDNPILSDKKMNLFLWWFEKNIKNAELTGSKTYSLTSESQKIEGVEYYPVEKLLARKECEAEKQEFYSNSSKIAENEKNTVNENDFQRIYEDFKNILSELKSYAKKGLSLCDKALQNRTLINETYIKLKKIDEYILNSNAKNAAALVFPTQKQLEKIANKINGPKELYSINYSKLIYQKLIDSINYLEKYL